MKRIRIFITGGTIDDLDYSLIEDEPTKHRSSISRMLKMSRVADYFRIKTLFHKDSRFISEQDRKTIYDNCRNCPERNIIITHGSITMVQTAKYLNGKKLDKTIVLVGSIIPANKPNSDALFNLGFACAAAQTMPSGVYIAMNGRIFLANNVRKNKKKVVFEKIRKSR